VREFRDGLVNGPEEPIYLVAKARLNQLERWAIPLEADTPVLARGTTDSSVQSVEPGKPQNVHAGEPDEPSQCSGRIHAVVFQKYRLYGPAPVRSCRRQPRSCNVLWMCL
jgi:hypothetical protein